jgi:hypothetical protein
MGYHTIKRKHNLKKKLGNLFKRILHLSQILIFMAQTHVTQ